MEVVMIGTTISHYKIVEKLGGGGMGVVYKAEDTKLRRIVALKFLSPDLARDEQAKTRFVHEAQAASALRHPNICTIHDIDETADNRLFIVMDFYEGKTLKEMIESGPLPIDKAIDVAIQVAQGLAKAHESGVVHRDIKPANILIGQDGIARIVDFGLAKLSGQTMLTKAGSTLGTEAYMSPEQARGESVDHRTDIWSLGVTMYEMVTGQLPFKSEYHDGLVYSLLNEQPSPMTGLRTGVPMELERITGKCVEKKAADRYQHADELLVDLRSLKRRVETGGAAQAAAVAKPLMRKKYAVYAGLFILVAAILLTVKVLLPTREVLDSIAVLPLENLSGDPAQEYFSDGMTDALITELQKIKSLRVISRTSVRQYKGTIKTLPEIARELNVKAVVEGSVLRDSDNVRINVQLLQASPEKHLWANAFDRKMKNVLGLQSEVARSIAQEIRVTVTPQEQTRLASGRPINTEAYQLYLQGRYHFAQRTLAAFNKSIQLFQQALDKDPDDALAYAGLAESYGILPFYGGALPKDAFPKAKAAALKALELDNSLAEAHAAVGFVLFYWDWDWPAAEKELLQAIDLKQSYVVAHHWYAEYLSAMGRHEQAVAEIKIAQELDPVSPLMLAIGGEVCNHAGRYDEAIEQCLKALELDPNFALAHGNLSGAYRRKGMYKESITEAEKSVELYGSTFDSLILQVHVYAVAGARAKALAILNQAAQRSNRPEFDTWEMAEVCAFLGETKGALDWLETAYDQRNPYLVFLNVEHDLDALHSERRFQDLVRRMNLPATKR
jgi:TolB-like protein/Tfp pilus assembly protein PilF